MCKSNDKKVQVQQSDEEQKQVVLLHCLDFCPGNQI